MSAVAPSDDPAQAAPPPGYSAPPPQAQGGYGAPPPQGGYGAPPPQGGYGAPPPQGGYGAPPPQGGYAPNNNNTMVSNNIVMTAPAPAPTTTVVVTKKQDNCCRAAIPEMHIAAAVICLILNIFFPGIGTIVAGFCVFCCGNPGQGGAGKVGTFCINFWVGCLQIGTVWFFLLGWIWSIMWGAAFIGMSPGYHNKDDEVTVVTSGGGGATVVSA